MARKLEMMQFALYALLEPHQAEAPFSPAIGAFNRSVPTAPEGTRKTDRLAGCPLCGGCGTGFASEATAVGGDGLEVILCNIP
jgi:hypothetical protein